MDIEKDKDTYMGTDMDMDLVMGMDTDIHMDSMHGDGFAL
jgi:hypothetical protein